MEFESNPNIQPKVQEAVYAPVHSSPDNQLSFVAKLCFFIWTAIPYIGIIILFILYSIQRSPASTKNYTATVGLEFLPSQKSTALLTTGVSMGNIVSVDENGLLQLGGGTSIYEGIFTSKQQCPKFVDIDAIYSRGYLVFYQHADTHQSTLQVVSMSNDLLKGDVSATLSSTIANSVPYYVHRVLTLSQSNGVFITISENYGDLGLTGQGMVVAGKVSSDLTKITTGTGVYFSQNDASVNPSIIRLSDTSFAICYFTYSSSPFYNNLYTQYGTVDLTTLTITLSDPKFVASDTNFVLNPRLVPLTSTRYFLVIASQSEGATDDAYKSPNAGFATITPVTIIFNSNNQKNEIIFGKGVKMPYVQFAFSFQGTRINDNTAVIIYYDYLANYALKSTIVRLDTTSISQKPANATVVIGSTYSLTSTKTANAQLSTQLYVDTIPFTNGNIGFVVMFSDFANAKKVTSLILEVTTSYEIIPASPKIVLSGAEPSGTIFWGSVTSTTGDSLALLQVYSNSKNCSADAATATVSLLEHRSKPIGIVSENTNTPQGTIPVTLSGTISGYTNLKPGSVYYSDTRGRLVKTSFAYGQQPNPSKATFVTSVDGTTLVSADALVGVAVSSNTLKIIEF